MEVQMACMPKNCDQGKVGQTACLPNFGTPSRTTNKICLAVDDHITYPEINQRIRMLPTHSLQNFTLKLYTYMFHRFTSHLFTFQNLRNLKLFNCFLNTEGCQGFSKLVSLNLRDCLLTPETFGKFVASCPAVEIITLNTCTSFDCLEFVFVEKFNSVSFENCPVLGRVKLYLFGMDGERFSFDLVKSLSCLPLLEELQLEACALKGLVEYVSSVIKPSIALKTLKNLNLRRRFFSKTEETSSAIYFIWSCPNLERLTITVTAFRQGSVADFLNLQNVKKQEFLTHLTTVKIQKFSGIESLMEFVKYLLASAPALEEMALVARDVSIMDDIEILNKLKEYPRASPRMEIIMKS